MNVVTLVGRLGQDPEMTTTQSGKELCKFTMATSRFKKGDPPDWHKCVAWGTTAGNISKYFHKGSQIAISGRIQNDVVEKDGRKTTYSTVVVGTFDFIDPKQERGQPTDNDSDEDLPF